TPRLARVSTSSSATVFFAMLFLPVPTLSFSRSWLDRSARSRTGATPRSSGGRSRDARRPLEAGARKMRVQPLSQEEPRAMQPHSDGGGGETNSLCDFPVRKPVDVAQELDDAVVGGQFCDRGAEHDAKLRLARGVIHGHRPVGNQRGVPTVLVEHRKDVGERHIGAAATPSPATLIGGVRYDPIEP